MSVRPGLVRLALASLWLLDPAGDSVADTSKGPYVVTSPETKEQLRREYLQIKRELTNRQFLSEVSAHTARPNLEFIKEHYGIAPDPEFTNMSISDLEGRIREIAVEIDRRALTYGAEDTKDIYLNPPLTPNPNRPFVSDPLILNAGKSVVAIVPRSALTRISNKWTLTTQPLVSVLGGTETLCTFDSFHGDPSTQLAGTGFLIGPDLIATAGHVVGYPPDEWMQSVYFLFGYVLESDDAARTIYSDEDVYEGTQVLVDRNDPRTDWALVRLDRTVTGRSPLPYRTVGKVASTASIYMLGHPNGMPLKYTGPAKILENTSCSKFLTDLDTHPYNSGSPVFNAADHVVEGILVSDVGNFEEYCDCMATATFTEAMGIPGAGVTRILDVAEYLAHPQSVVVQCQIPVAKITSGGVDTWFNQGQTANLPYQDLGMDLLVNTDCSLHYTPNPGETWVIKTVPPGGGVLMERSCPE